MMNSVFKNNILHKLCLFLQAEKDAEKDKKRPGSRGSAKSKSSKEREAEPQEPPSEENLAPPERYWPVGKFVALKQYEQLSAYTLYITVERLILLNFKIKMSLMVLKGAILIIIRTFAS